MSDPTPGPADAARPQRRSGTNRPNVSRAWDSWAGGKDHYPTDAEVAARIVTILPNIRESVRANRRFVLEAPKYLARELDIRQFLDIGAGLPQTTGANLHEAVQSVVPEARIVHVDNDPAAVLRCRAQLVSAPSGQVTTVEGDVRRAEDILAHPEVTAALDFTRPVAVCLHALVHFLGDEEDPRGLIRRLMRGVPEGSALTLTHATADFAPEASAEAEAVYRQAGLPAVHHRSRQQVAELVAGLELLDPGITPVERWTAPGPSAQPTSRTRPPAENALGYALVARKH